LKIDLAEAVEESLELLILANLRIHHSLLVYVIAPAPFAILENQCDAVAIGELECGDQ
jgi:hypothetical protein